MPPHLLVRLCLPGGTTHKRHNHLLRSHRPRKRNHRVKTFEQFFFLRTLTGVAVGGAFPLIYSLASDVTNSKQRALASSTITICMGVGGMLGQGVAGMFSVYVYNNGFLR